MFSSSLIAKVSLPVTKLSPTVQLSKTTLELNIAFKPYTPSTFSFTISLTTDMLVTTSGMILPLKASGVADSKDQSLTLKVQTLAPVSNPFGWSALTIQPFNGTLVLTPNFPYISALSVKGGLSLGAIQGVVSLTTSKMLEQWTMCAQMSRLTLSTLLTAVVPNSPPYAPWLAANGGSKGLYGLAFPAGWNCLTSDGLRMAVDLGVAQALASTPRDVVQAMAGANQFLVELKVFDLIRALVDVATANKVISLPVFPALKLGDLTIGINTIQVAMNPLGLAIGGSMSFQGAVVATNLVVALNPGVELGFNMRFHGDLWGKLLSALAGHPVSPMLVVDDLYMSFATERLSSLPPLLNIFPASMAGAVQPGLVLSCTGRWDPKSDLPLVQSLATIFPGTFSVRVAFDSKGLSAFISIASAKLGNVVLRATTVTMKIVFSPFSIDVDFSSIISIPIGGNNVEFTFHAAPKTSDMTFLVRVRVRVCVCVGMCALGGPG